MQRTSRLKRELSLLAAEPPPGITCWQDGDRMEDLRAQILGGANTPYEKGVFKLEVHIPERYPFEPPQIRFLTPIYHPNIDAAGRICLDVLKLPPKGAWRPSLNIATLLTSVQQLMAEPNPDDPLMADIVSAQPTFPMSHTLSRRGVELSSVAAGADKSCLSPFTLCFRLSPQSLNTTSQSSSRTPGSGQRSTHGRRWGAWSPDFLPPLVCCM
uniref:Ubiquitin-conjugating enzyme E2 T n=1 Tax=Capra hircus TaxID=9925 RepID=A0A8C2RVT7_CAPHI